MTGQDCSDLLGTYFLQIPSKQMLTRLTHHISFLESPKQPYSQLLILFSQNQVVQRGFCSK